jgi:DNA-directed RNA polymerase specialized sigma24 family protein
LSNINGGDGAALAKLYDRYFPFLVALARSSVSRASGQVNESIVQSALLRFRRHADREETPRLANRGELINLLTSAVARKALANLRSDPTQHGSALQAVEASLAHAGPTPGEVALSRDLYGQFTDILEIDLRPFAEMHLAGWPVKEIACQMKCAESTVHRKVDRIQLTWAEKVKAA